MSGEITTNIDGFTTADLIVVEASGSRDLRKCLAQVPEAAELALEGLRAVS